MRLILSSLTYPLANGVTNSINVTVDGLVEAGHDVVVVAPDYGTGKIRPEHFPVSSSRISEIATKQFGNGERFFSVRAVAEIQKIVDQFQPDIYWLHTVTWAPNIFEVMLQRSKKIKILTYHTMVSNYGKIYFGALGEQQMINRSREVAGLMDAVIAPSHYVEGLLRDWKVKQPITVIPTGIEETKSGYSSSELKSKWHIPKQNAVLLTVGRVVREKNISALFRTLAQVVKHNPRVTHLVVGPGHLDDFKREARSLGIENNVVMTDSVPADEARKMYWGADLFFFASQSETQGMVFGEAMNAGLPIAALTSPIQPEFYPESVAAVAKTEAQLAGHVLALLGDRHRRDQLRAAGKKLFIDELSVAAMTRKQLELFNGLVGRGQ